MMLKLVPLTALVLGLSGGVAAADHGRGGDHRGASVEHRSAPQAHATFHGGGGAPFHGGGEVVVRDHGGRGGYGGQINYRDRGYREVSYGGRGYGGHGFVQAGPRYERRPIYVSRPVIRERYYSYNRRPALIVENYDSMAGYYWVAGAWSWTGYEWTWQPGHYEPDASYYDGGY